MRTVTIGAFYDKAGRFIGAGDGANRLKTYFDKHYSSVKPGKVVGNSNILNNKGVDVAAFCSELRCEVEKCLSDGDFPMIFGGDHSIAIGSIAGALNGGYRRVGVVYIDAHADMNTFETSATKNIHGMPLAVCMGYGDKILTDVVPYKLDSRNLFLLGTRSIDDGERVLMDSLKIKSLSAEFIRENGIEAVGTHLRTYIIDNHIEYIHLSFDIDVIDPTYAPATGVPENDGITPLQAYRLVELVFNTGLVGSMDFVEYNPLLDTDDQTGILCEAFIDKISRLLKV